MAEPDFVASPPQPIPTNDVFDKSRFGLPRSVETGAAQSENAVPQSGVAAPPRGAGGEIPISNRCPRCDRVGHTSDACPFYKGARENHPDASWGDTTPHLQQTEISITLGGEVVERSQRQPGWWQGKRVEVSVNGIWFVLGRASGESCNCLIDTLRQLLPTNLWSVSFVRAELERRHARTPTAIAPLDFLDLALYWSDIVDISGQYNMLGRIQKLSSRFRICCVDMCWVGHGEVLPRDVPASARQTLYVARVNQNHFVPLQRSRQRGGEVPRANIAGAATKKHMGSRVAGNVTISCLPN